VSDYLEGYGEREARRSKLIRWSLISAAVVLVGGTILYFTFRDFRQERHVRAFLERVRARDYRAAYAHWGCTEQNPCPNYPFEEFLKDWGAQGVYASENSQIVGKKSCDGGVIEILRVPGQPDVLLWVDRSDPALSFAPWTLKTVPPGFKGRLQEWMWNVTRNCKPIIGP
jgi:hypothetical protein